ncbi:sugar transferase [Terribacillus halophilus]|uniref:sugar transferase n=1 Tax=Terribacillus halophilus TaxID=361279 RepID=UPI000985C148|nr:sugar transferase [Terribacillus halophilus]
MGKLKENVLNVLEANTELKKGSRFYTILKRITDITLSFIGIIILSPIFILVALLIKLEDKDGPILFKQVRVGKEGQTFQIFKFRTMVSNAEDLLTELLDKNEATGPLFKMKDDPRITKVGKFLRKTSLDELPQLLNVIKGEMSLVGPRPALPREVNKYNTYQRQRLTVLPGLTCYWQVQGRSNIGFEEQVELDLKYIKQRSFVLDIKLIVLTFKVLFGSKDAF